jgi:hypothetical protein
MVEEAESLVRKPKSFNRRPWTDMVTRRGDVLTIMPDEAAYILQEMNPTNRAISKFHENEIVQVIKSGRWKDNGEAIIFDYEGHLKNGQHRLRACVLTGIPIMVSVSFGVEPDVFDTIDRGKKRCLGDDLSIIGEPNSRALAAVLGALWYDDQGKIDKLARDASPPLDVAKALLEKHPDIRRFVSWASTYKKKAVLEPRLLAYCYYTCSQVDPGAADKFFKDLVDGANLNQGDPVLVLRDMLMRNKADKIRVSAPEMIASVRNAWNLRRKSPGRPITKNRLLWRQIGKQTEPLPAIL